MQILVVAATDFELAPFVQQHPESECLITGVGSAATAYWLTKQLILKKYDLVMQVGLAGVYNDQMPLSKAVIVGADRFADLGAMEKHTFRHIASMGFMDENVFPYQQGWLHNPHLYLFQNFPDVVHGNTVNMITDEKQHIQTVQAGAVVESMEGAALHYVCLMEAVPFLQIRGISNHVGDRNKSNWQLQEAIMHSCELLTKLYQEKINSNPR
jgi:futalosine hydrolase